MTKHVSDEALVDLAFGEGRDGDRGHLAACEPCARRLDEVRATLEQARRASVPEPSPLYWEAMRRSVGRQIAAEPRRAPRWAWLGTVAAAAAAVAIVALSLGRPSPPGLAPESKLPAWSALPPADEDLALEVLAVADVSFAPLEEARTADAILATLSEEEVEALAESLRTEEGGQS